MKKFQQGNTNELNLQCRMEMGQLNQFQKKSAERWG